MSTSFLLDANTSATLKEFLPKDSKKTVELGLSARADDMDVINLALLERAVLISSDVGIVSKAKTYQRQYVCLYGLLILPNGIEHQRRILTDLKKGRKVLRFRDIERPLTWPRIRDLNFLVRAGLEGHPHVTELCDCKAWKD